MRTLNIEGIDPFEQFGLLASQAFSVGAECGHRPDFSDRVSSMLRDPAQAESALRLLLWRPLPTALEFLEDILFNLVDGSPRIGISMSLSLLRALPKEQMDERLDDILPRLMARLDSDQMASVAYVLVEFGMVRHFGFVADHLEREGEPGDRALIERLRNAPRNPEFWRRCREDVVRDKSGRAPGVDR